MTTIQPTGPFVGPPRSSALPTTLSTAISTSVTGAPSSTSFALAPNPITSTTHSDRAPNTSSTSSPNGQIGPDDDVTQDRKGGLLNYYFVFLAIFILLLFVGVYMLHRRKKALKARHQTSAQSALARDLNGWTNTRRWMHGNFRTDTAPRNEGLNELGEAPPPYVPAAAAAAGAGRDGNELQIPLRAMSRDGTGVKPPDYGEAMRHSVMVNNTADDRQVTGLPSTSDAHGVETQGPGPPRSTPS